MNAPAPVVGVQKPGLRAWLAALLGQHRLMSAPCQFAVPKTSVITISAAGARTSQ